MHFWFSAYCKFKTQLLIMKIGCSCRQTFHCTLNFFYSFSFLVRMRNMSTPDLSADPDATSFRKNKWHILGLSSDMSECEATQWGYFFFLPFCTHTHIRRPTEKPQTITVGFLSSGDLEFNRQVSSVKTVQFTHKTETPQTVCSLVCRYFEQQSIKKNKNKKKNVRCE